MKTTRRVTTTVAVLGLILAGCSKSEETKANEQSAAPAPTVAEAPQQTAEAPAAEPAVTADWSLPGASADLPATAEAVLAERAIGSPDAPVTIVEHSSLTCPHCANLHATILPRLKNELIDTGKVRLVFQDYPLDGLAAAATIMARCAPPKNYFKLINALFHDQESWRDSEKPIDRLVGYMALAGLPRDRALACLEDKALLQGVQAWMTVAEQQYGVKSTPTLIVGGEVLKNVHSYEELAAVIAKHAP